MKTKFRTFISNVLGLCPYTKKKFSVKVSIKTSDFDIYLLSYYMAQSRNRILGLRNVA